MWLFCFQDGSVWGDDGLMQVDGWGGAQCMVEGGERLVHHPQRAEAVLWTISACVGRLGCRD